jgi:diguanylate cyclase (GGDEF)-like protein
MAMLFRLCFVVLGVASGPALLVAPGVGDWLTVGVWAVLTGVVAWFGLGLPSSRGVFSLEWVCVLAVLATQGLQAGMVVALVAALLGAWRTGGAWVPWFEASLAVLAVQAGWGMYGMVAPGTWRGGEAAALPLAALAIFAAKEMPRAAARALAERQRLLDVWRESSLWTVPYHLAGSALAGLLLLTQPLPVWVVALVGAPVFVLLSRAYGAQVGGVEQERVKAAEVTTLQTEMLEALALAVEARESGGRPNLHRIGRTARLLGESLGMAANDLKALELAALLHDIGKMAVPDYILSKPGRLLPEEFERLKLHPVVASEIVQRARLPYPVAPMIRSHHERWDGQGYPDGLRGDRIPKGGRILAVVDAVDALLSERKYRRALPLGKAIEAIERDAGSAYDPAVVQALREQQSELERVLRDNEEGSKPLPGFLSAIAEAHREEMQVQDLLGELSSTLDIEAILPVVEERLKRIVPHTCAALWALKDGRLHLVRACGQWSERFAGAVLEEGAGASGRAALKRSVQVQAPAAGELSSILGNLPQLEGATAIAVPLVSDQGAPGVFTVYGLGRTVFEGRHARLLAAFAPRFASWLESARRYQRAEEQASLDALTGLPNAAGLYLQLQQEIARNARADRRLAVLVCDLDGFKAVNDTFGHLAGNQVLQAVATGLRERCREYDFVARMGGDEFVILLPGIGNESIEDRVRSFGLAVTEAGRRVCGHPVVSLSIGVAFSPADGVAPDELLARGDERMYANKRLRKSRGVVSPDTAHAMYPGL